MENREVTCNVDAPTAELLCGVGTQHDRRSDAKLSSDVAELCDSVELSGAPSHNGSQSSQRVAVGLGRARSMGAMS